MNVTIQQPHFLGLLNGSSLAFGGLKGEKSYSSPFSSEKMRSFIEYRE